MQQQTACARVRRWVLAASLLFLLVVPAIPAAADTNLPAVPGGPSATGSGGDPRIPNHQAEWEYFASMRQAPAGTSPSQARVAAQQAASNLPVLATVPPALSPAGVATGPRRDTLYVPAGTWQTLGPVGNDSDQANPTNDYRYGRVSGRATAVVVGSHTGVIYLGTADGGVWKSTNDGASWTVLTDAQPSLAVGALALDPADTTDNTLYVGTGETSYDLQTTPVFNGDAYFGVGVLKTTNGGTTWTLQGQSVFGGGTYNANSIGFDVLRVDGTTIRAGTTKGMFQSTDGGTTWTPVTVSSGSPTRRVTDIAVDPSNTNNVYVVLSEAQPTASNAGFYRSTTGGGSGTFTQITTGLPAASGWGRTRLALAPSAPATLYLAITDGSELVGVYKTTNGGTNWAATTGAAPNFVDGFPPGNGQGFYDVYIVVDPNNASHLYAGGVYMAATIDGGATWTNIGDVYCALAPAPHFPCRGPLHPDQHAGFVTTAGALYAANDGGIWKSANPNLGTSTTWTDLNANINTIQYYAGDVAANFLTTPVVAGGAQDNGSSRTTSASAALWNGILGGDGGYVAIDKSNPNTMYAEYQNGAVQKTTNANAGTSISWTDITPSCNGSPFSSGSLFIAPFVLDPNHNNHLAFGGAWRVCESTNNGTSWYTSSTNSLAGFVQSLAIAPSNSAVIYAGTDGGHVWRTTAGNSGSSSTWTDVSTGLPTAPATAIAVDPADANTVYVTFGNFGVGHVWKTTNGGTSWTNITHNLPDIPTTAIVTYPSTSGPVLIVGTDIGVYASVNGGTTWQTLATGLPNVGIQQLFLDQARTTLFAATHGRGMWQIGIPTATGLTLTGLPATSGDGVPTPFTVTANDPGYTGTVHFTSTDGVAVLPADYTFTGSGAGKDNGTHTFSVTFRTMGAQTVTVTDTRTSTLTAQASTTVVPGVAAITPSSGTSAGGNKVTLTGGGFGTDPTKVTVTFGGVGATIISVTDTQLVVTAPAGTGTVTVTVTVNGVAATPTVTYTYGTVNPEPDTPRPGPSVGGTPNSEPDGRANPAPSGGTPDTSPPPRP